MSSDPSQFKPTRPQDLARERVRLHLESAGMSVQLHAYPFQQIAQWARAPKLAEWLQDPTFSAWFLADFEPEAQRRINVAANYRWLELVRDDPHVEIAVQLKAVQEMLKLDGAYPAKAATVRFADAEVDGMTDDEASAELARLKAQLGPSDKN